MEQRKISYTSIQCRFVYTVYPILQNSYRAAAEKEPNVYIRLKR